MITSKEMDKIIQKNERYILHWIENGKTLKWCAEYLKVPYKSFCEAIKRDGIDWKYVRENGRINKLNEEHRERKMSEGEHAIAKLLDMCNIPYKQEYTFQDFRYTDINGVPRFDFAIFSVSAN